LVGEKILDVIKMQGTTIKKNMKYIVYTPIQNCINFKLYLCYPPKNFANNFNNI